MTDLPDPTRQLKHLLTIEARCRVVTHRSRFPEKLKIRNSKYLRKWTDAHDHPAVNTTYESSSPCRVPAVRVLWRSIRNSPEGEFMPKGEHTIVQTTLSTDQVRNVLGDVLSGATIEDLRTTALENDAELAIVASQFGGVAFQRSPFGTGNAVAQIIVEDHGASREVELIAIRDTFGESFTRQRAAANAFEGLSAAKHSPKLRAGRSMVQAILAALKTADQNLQVK